jgi:hypothetical protein
LSKKLHIISLDIPYPADYGGAIDIFYKVKALHEQGIAIILHCFQYGKRLPHTELEQYCHKVFYYPRKTGWKGIHPKLPYIISSRQHPELLRNLCIDNEAILFEGIHTTLLANHPALAHRKKIYRAHNIESDYYRGMAKNGLLSFRQCYFFIESFLLKRYEKALPSFQHILAISPADCEWFQQHHPHISTSLLLPFHPYEAVCNLAGKGNFCLYHGNLSVNENQESAAYLAKEVFSELDFSLLIAGKEPSLAVSAWESQQIRIIPNPSKDNLQSLVRQAQVNVLPSFQMSGMKLKILYALFSGRHCISNDAALCEYIGDTLHYASSTEVWREKITDLMNKPFTAEDIKKRSVAMQAFNNKTNVAILVSLL